MFKLLKYLLVIIIPFFFFLNPFLPWPKDLIFEAAGHGIGVLAFFNSWETHTAAPLFWGHTSYMLGQISLAIVYLIGGASTFTTILNTSLLAFFSIILTCFFTRKILGELGGFIALVLFSGSLFFLMVIKTAYPFYGTAPLTVSIALFLVILSHRNLNKKLLYLVGVAFAFVGFSGGQSFPLSVIISIFFLFWKIVRKEKLFSLKSYLISFFVFLFVFISFHALFPLTTYNKPFEYLDGTYRILFQRGGEVALKGGINDRIENFNRLTKAFFFDMGIPGQGHQQNMAKRAMLPFPISLLFIIGFITAFFRKKDLDKMLIVWNLVFFIFYGFFADFQVRYFLAAAPGIYCLSALGADSLIKKYKSIYVNMAVITVIIFYLVSTYKDYYLTMYSQAFKLEIYEGQAELADYVKSHYNPKDNYLVFGNVNNIFPQNFIFYTWNMPYKFSHWNFFSDTATYTPVESEVIKSKPAGLASEEMKDQYLAWEKGKLKQYKKLVYALGYYNSDLTLTTEMKFFLRLHPYLRPIKIIYASTKLPQIAIYEISEKEADIISKDITLNPGQTFELLSPKKSLVKSITVKGNDKNIVFYINDKKINLNAKIFPSETLYLNPGEKSKLIFNPSFAKKNILEDAVEVRNLIFFPGGISGQEEREGYIVYKLEALGKINNLNVHFFPRIYNDKEKEAFLSLSLENNNEFKKVYELLSDGTRGWIGIWEKRERVILFPNAELAILKFTLSGQDSQLLSDDKTTMSFEAEFNYPLDKILINRGNNTITYSEGKNPLSLTLYY